MDTSPTNDDAQRLEAEIMAYLCVNPALTDRELARVLGVDEQAVACTAEGLYLSGKLRVDGCRRVPSESRRLTPRLFVASERRQI